VSTTQYLPAAVAVTAVAVAAALHLRRRRAATPVCSPAAAGMRRRDRLTGLGDRAAFHEAINAAGQHRQVAVILLNLDGSTAFIARVGDRAFDQLLVLIAGRVDHVVTAAGGSVFRLRRDEFGIIGTHDAADAGDVAARVVDAVAEPTELHACGQMSTVAVTACAGVTTFAAGVSADARRGLVQADTAMRCAKRAGRGRIAVFTPPTPPEPPDRPPASDGGATR
jgi:diguanylate cyclase (GGDEF)-like protein